MRFDGSDYVKHAARRLIAEFGFSSGAGTPGLVGAAKESPARKQLANLLPSRVCVGSGLVVDSQARVSKQQDIVVYEDVCPVFTHDETAEATYYPVEGVMSAGEVKSALGRAELADVFEKSRSVKILKRQAIPSKNILVSDETVSTRSYSSLQSWAVTKEEEFDQSKNSLHQVFTFALCERFSSTAAKTVENAAEFAMEYGIENAPNFVLSLNDGFITPHNQTSESMVRAAFEGDGFMFCDEAEAGLGILLERLRAYFRAGKTVEHERYESYFRPANHNGQYRIAAYSAFTPDVP